MIDARCTSCREHVDAMGVCPGVEWNDGAMACHTPVADGVDLDYYTSEPAGPKERGHWTDSPTGADRDGGPRAGTGFSPILSPVPDLLSSADCRTAPPTSPSAVEAEPGAPRVPPRARGALAGHCLQSLQEMHANRCRFEPARYVGVSASVVGDDNNNKTRRPDSRGDRAARPFFAMHPNAIAVAIAVAAALWLSASSAHAGIVAGRGGAVGCKEFTPQTSAVMDGARQKKLFTPHRTWGERLGGPPIMATNTTYGPTPWSTGELAAHHGCAGGRALEIQRRLDELVVEVLAPPLVAAGTRADQAAESILASAERLVRLSRAAGRREVKHHITHLVKVAYDRAVEKRLESAARRFPRDTATTETQRRGGAAYAQRQRACRGAANGEAGRAGA